MAKTFSPVDWRILPVALAGVLVLGGQSAWACGGGKLLFQDKFQTLDPRWQLPLSDPARRLGADGLSYSLAPNNWIQPINQASLYNDYELCAHSTMKYSDEKSNASVGIAFWAEDDSDFYNFSICPRDGTYTVTRLQKNKRLVQIPWGEPTPAINKGSGQENELSVAVRGNHAVFSVNNQKVAELDGQPPDGGSEIGFILNSPKTDQGPTEFAITDIEVWSEPGSDKPHGADSTVGRGVQPSSGGGLK